ncbi:hypothetical protein TWF694_000374 [Orbilia ellipsospora]|uniref:Nephrocystin 3-like N-terminal domain-containing protein n=1 Tax=Orbilia ellipsospora TaxID=2528407 RepID=A0AAV9XNV6_9PEZI
MAAPRKTFSVCFQEAVSRFRLEVANPLLVKDPKRSLAVDEFLKGKNLSDLQQDCHQLSSQVEDKANSANHLWSTLDRISGAADIFLQFAPESVSMVWWGIGTLITIGNAGVQTKLLICETCDNIANIVGDCVRWEARMAYVGEDAVKQFDIWEEDVPELVFSILDFLWNAKPHLSASRVKRIGSTLKDLITQDMQQKVGALQEKYQKVIKAAQAHFEESVFHETFKTSQRVQEILKGFDSYVSISMDMVDAVRKQNLLLELDRQQARLTHSNSYKIHFQNLNDRLSQILNSRKGRPVANWLLKDQEYLDWKDGIDIDAPLLCLKAPRGRGKSVAMMSIYRNVQNTLVSQGDQTASIDTRRRPLVCHFFFKRGEQEIQKTRHALESLLFQLLNSTMLRKDTTALLTVVEILCPTFGETDANAPSSDVEFTESPQTLCDTIKSIAAVIPERVYLMVDALDECQDRKQQAFVQCLKSLVRPDALAKGEERKHFKPTSSKQLKLIISTRDSINIEEEMADPADELKASSNTARSIIPGDCKVIEITSDKNSSDLRDFIQQEATEVLSRRIEREEFPELFDKELTRIVDIMHGKVNGDFTLTRLIIASLQQPSKDSLEKRIQRLPSAIGDIYLASLESLTPDEQELIVTTLKWVVWSVSSVTVLEISDHYRERYYSSLSEGTSNSNGTDQETQNFTQNTHTQIDPFKDPDIKDTIFHLENAGRDFFRFDKNTGIVNVDISIREWIQDENLGRSNSGTKDNRGFTKFRDDMGNTVFKFTLTPSFVRYGDRLSELFDEREAQMSIAINIMKALNNEDFQAEHMSWEPNMLFADYREPRRRRRQPSTLDATPGPRRYEIDHWQDHIKILQRWWTDKSIDDVWWSPLLTELSTFTKPQNWYIWNLQRKTTELDDTRQEIYFSRLFEHPIHVASKFGLHLMVDLLIREAQANSQSKDSGFPTEPVPEKITAMRLRAFLDFSKVKMLERENIATILPYLDRNQLVDLMQPYQKLQLPLSDGKRIMIEHSASLLKGVHDGMRAAAGQQTPKAPMSYTEKIEARNLKYLATVLTDLPPTAWIDRKEAICDKLDGGCQTPLFHAAPHPKTTEALISHGADVNVYSKDVPILYDILGNLSRKIDTYSKDDVLSILQSARILVSQGACLNALDEDIPTLNKASLLHYAAKIQDLSFFKFLYASGDWDPLARDEYDSTPLHYLFERRCPADPAKVKEVLDICRIIAKMKSPNGDELNVLNAENSDSQNVLAYAVSSSFKEAVELLIELGIDIHDEDDSGTNCFHHLASSILQQNPETDLEIAETLLRGGLDILKIDESGRTALSEAVTCRKFHLVRFFLEQYDTLIAEGGLEFNPLLLQDMTGRTLYHMLASPSILTSKIYTEPGQEPPLSDMFEELSKIIGKYTEVEEFINKPDNSGRPPLYAAIGAGETDAVKAIIALKPNLKGRSGRWVTAMEAATLEIISEAGFLKTQGGSETGLDTAIDIFNILLKNHPSNLSLSCISNAIFSLEAPILERLGISKLIQEYGTDFRDEHKWSLFDLMSASAWNSNERVLVTQFLPSGTPSQPNSFATPSKIGWCTQGSQVSNDGLGAAIATDSIISHISVISDHPIPPIHGTFYFEIQTPFNIKNRISDNPKDVSKLRIGLRTVADGSDSHIFWRPCSGTLDIYFRDHRRLEDVKKNLGIMPDDCDSGEDRTVFGCGLNRDNRKVFFTVNGKPLQQYWIMEPARFFPEITCGRTESFRLNFGHEPFKFQAANHPNFDWDPEEATEDM